MRLMTIVTILWFAAGFSGYVRAADKQEYKAVPKDNVYNLTLSDGSVLTIGTRMLSRTDRGESDVWVALRATDEDEYGHVREVWAADFTSVNYAPETPAYYALVKVMEDRIFVFAMWNGRWCVIDKRAGRVLDKGNGDDVLREYRDLVPLKLTTLFIGPSETERLQTPQERLEKFEKTELEADKIAISLSQTIPESKLRNQYVVQFDAHQDAHAELRQWRPRYVVVWKAEKASVSLDSCSDIASIRVNGHSVTPPAAQKAIYLLQPDYSLRQLSLSEKEISHLFSPITRLEKRATASYQRHTFPTDARWEQIVDPHLKIVELTRKKAK